MKINYTNGFGWSTPTARKDFITNPYLYAKVSDAAINGYNGSSFSGFNAADYKKLKEVANGKIDPFYEKQPNGTYKFFYDTDWYHYLFRKWRPTQFHNITISGGSDKIQAYLSGRLQDVSHMERIVPTKYKKYNLLGKISFNVTNWLQVGGNFRFMSADNMYYAGDSHGWGGLYGYTSTTWEYLFPYYPTNIAGFPIDIHGTGTHAAQEAVAKGESGGNFRHYQPRTTRITFRGKLDPIKNLNIKFNYTYEFHTTQRVQRLSPFSYYTGKRLTLKTVGLNQLTMERWRYFPKTLNIYGSYSKSIAKKNNFKLMLGFNQHSFERRRVAVTKDTLLTPFLTNLRLATGLKSAEGSTLSYATRGYFGRFNYNYEDKYLLEVNARYDGSSRFPKDSRWGFFPSVSAGWRISDESFWEPIKNIVSSLKLRGSYGALGNQEVSVYSFTQLMSLNHNSWLDNSGHGLLYTSAPGPLPSNVSWETVKILDLGLDVGFLQDKISATFDWYVKIQTGCMYPARLFHPYLVLHRQKKILPG